MRPYTTAPMFGSTRDVSEWKSQALAGFPTFSATVLTLRQRTRSGEGPALKQIGQLEWSRALSNRAASSIGQRNRSIDPEHPRLGVQQPCELPGVPCLATTRGRSTREPVAYFGRWTNSISRAPLVGQSSDGCPVGGQPQLSPTAKAVAVQAHSVELESN